MLEQKVMEREHKKAAVHLVMSYWLTYTLSICLKLTYGTSMMVIKEEYMIPSAMLLGLPITLHYLTYAVIQLILAVVIGRLRFKRYLLLTFLPAGLLYASVFAFSPVWYLNVVMALGGVLLGAVWCGALQMFRKFLPPPVLTRSLLFMSIGFSVGSMLPFAVSALSMKLGNWRYSFLVFGVLFVLASLYLAWALRRAEVSGLNPGDRAETKEARPLPSMPRAAAGALVAMAIAIIIVQSVLYYGFSNWMPTILKSNFHLANERATLLSTLLPLVSYAGPVLAQFSYNRLKSDYVSTSLLAGTCAVLALVLSLFYQMNLALTLILILGSCIFLRAVSMVESTLVPVHVGGVINAGSAAAVINAFACVAAAASPLMIGAILDAGGQDWSLCFLALFGLAVVMFVISVLFTVVHTVERRRQQRRNGLSHHV